MSTLTLPYLEKCPQNDGFFVEKNAQFFAAQFSAEFGALPENWLL